MSRLITDAANLLLLIGLAVCGLMLFADYSARGRWARNATSLLAALGMISLALALALTPEDAELLGRLARSGLSRLLLGVSSLLLLMAMGTFGLITYMRPLRLRHEKRIGR